MLLHSDQGGQFTSHDRQDSLKANNFIASRRRRGNCHGNAVAEKLFKFLKREPTNLRMYHSREESKVDVFDYIEMSYT